MSPARLDTTGPGTDEPAWLSFLSQLAAPPLRLDPPPSRVLVVAPHPDDEVLACGGLAALLAAVGSRVSVLAVTDGEASNPRGSLAPVELARRRRAESAAALAHLGNPAVTRLGLLDGAGDALEEPVLRALTETVADEDPAQTWLLAPWTGEGHPDHEAVGRAAEGAAASTGCRLLGYLVWTWHWAEPEAEQVPWSRLRTVPLPADVQAAKAAAIDEFATQVRPAGPLPGDAPVLTPAVLARFARPFESLLVPAEEPRP